MFAVASLFAEECASQGHADFVKEVVDDLTDFIATRLVPWLTSQGGWVSRASTINSVLVNSKSIFQA